MSVTKPKANAENAPTPQSLDVQDMALTGSIWAYLCDGLGVAPLSVEMPTRRNARTFLVLLPTGVRDRVTPLMRAHVAEAVALQWPKVDALAWREPQSAQA